MNLPGSPTLKELPLNKNDEPKIEIITSVDDHSPLRNISLPNNFINHKLSLLFTLHITKYQIISNKHRQNNVNYNIPKNIPLIVNLSAILVFMHLY